MGQNSKIEWTHHTANLWQGCTKVHAGCNSCYAETLAKRWGNDVWGNDKMRLEVKSVWSNFKKFQKDAAATGEIHRVFVGSMMDIFEKPMPVMDSKGRPAGITTEDLRQIFFRVVVPSSPNLMFLLLTKRPSNINKYIPYGWKLNPPKNVMYGCSPVNQETFDNFIQHMHEVGGKKFLSVEPQLGPIDICKMYPVGKGEVAMGLLIDWIIQGGESGPGKRPFNLDWARSMRKQCEAFNIPYFFKQIDKVQEIPEELLIRQFPE